MKDKQSIANEELKQLRAMVSFLKEQKNKLELQLSQEQMQLSTAHAEIISLRNNNTKLIREHKERTMNSFLKAKQGGVGGGGVGEDDVGEKSGEEVVTARAGGAADDVLGNSLLSELEQAELENIGKKENDEVTDLKKLISEREQRLLALQKTLRAKESELEAKELQWKNEAEVTSGELKALRDAIAEKGDQMNALRQKFEEVSRANAALKNVEGELQERLALKDQELRTTLRSALERLSKSQEGEVNALKAERDELERELDKKEKECVQLEKQMAKELKWLKMEYELDRTLEAKRRKGGESTPAARTASIGSTAIEGGSSQGGRGNGGSGWWNNLMCAFPGCFRPPNDELELPTAEEFEMRPKRKDRYSAMRELKDY